MTRSKDTGNHGLRIILISAVVASVAGSCTNKKPEDSVGILVCTGIASNAGLDQSVILGNTVNLDATGSTTCENGSPVFTWSFQSVPTDSTISDSSLTDNGSITASSTAFTPDIAGDYVLSVRVSDRTFDESSTPDIVVITVAPGDLPPIADCGGDVEGEVGVSTSLDGGGSYDPEAHELDYIWSLAGVPDCSALTSNDLASAGDAIASVVPDCNGYYTLSLVVSDGFQYSSADYCNVRVEADDQMPVADAGEGGTVPPCDGDVIHLNGYSSYDPEGAKLTYEWSILIVPPGSSAGNNNFSDREIAEPTFQWDVEGTYRFQLQVFDGGQWSAPDIVEHVATGTGENVAPIANAGADEVIEHEADCESSSYVWTCEDCPETVVTLDGTLSMDANGDDLSYLWTEPEAELTLDTPNSAFTYARREAIVASYGVEVIEQYTVDLEVADCLESDNDSMNITISCVGTYSP